MTTTETVQVVLADVDRSAGELERWEITAQSLSPSERQRAETFRDAAGRGRWRAAHILLRFAVHELADVDRALSGAELSADPLGRPVIAGVERFLSLSHSGRFAMVAVGAVGPIGVDVEDRSAVHRLSPARAERIVMAGTGLGSMGPSPLDLLGAWVRLEAFAKARGAGLWPLLGEVGVHGGARTLDEIRNRAAAVIGRSGLVVSDLGELGCDCAAALALPAGNARIALHVLPPLLGAIPSGWSGSPATQPASS